MTARSWRRPAPTDLYAPVAASLGVERAVAKVAVLAAMYGQRSGAAGEALRGLERAYPAAMAYLDRAYAAGVRRQPLRTFGGRAIPLGRVLVSDGSAGAARGDARGEGAAPVGAARVGAARVGVQHPSARWRCRLRTRERAMAPAPGRGQAGTSAGISAQTSAWNTAGFLGGDLGADLADRARGRFARNAVVQVPPPSLFKAWAATVRATTGDLGAQIVLCLHDEPARARPRAAASKRPGRVVAALDDSARRWTGTTQVRFVADTASSGAGRTQKAEVRATTWHGVPHDRPQAHGAAGQRPPRPRNHRAGGLRRLRAAAPDHRVDRAADRLGPGIRPGGRPCAAIPWPVAHAGNVLWSVSSPSAWGSGRLRDAIVGHPASGKDAGPRAKAAAKAVVYLALGWTVFGFARGKSSDSTQQTVDFTATLMSSLVAAGSWPRRPS